MSETEGIIHNCIKGDRNAQNQLYQLFATRMLTVCLRYAKNKEEAEDILQEGFMKVFTSLRQFNFEGSFEGWIRKIMVNCALQKYRGSSKLHAVVDIDNNQPEIGEPENALALIGTKELLTMVQQLPPGYRLVFNPVCF